MRNKWATFGGFCNRCLKLVREKPLEFILGCWSHYLCTKCKSLSSTHFFMVCLTMGLHEIKCVWGEKKKWHSRILALQHFNSFSQWQTETTADAFEVKFNLRKVKLLRRPLDGKAVSGFFFLNLLNFTEQSIGRQRRWRALLTGGKVMTFLFLFILNKLCAFN